MQIDSLRLGLCRKSPVDLKIAHITAITVESLTVIRAIMLKFFQDNLLYIHVICG